VGSESRQGAISRPKPAGLRPLAAAATGSAGSIDEFRGFLADLAPEQPPGDVPRRRWRQFLDDARAFLDSGFATQATALGWTVTDLFGCDDAAPFARIDKMGLIWLLHGDRLLAITADTAIIETGSGARMTFRRRAPRILSDIPP
jgi:hypothetical protein